MTANWQKKILFNLLNWQCQKVFQLNFDAFIEKRQKLHPLPSKRVVHEQKVHVHKTIQLEVWVLL